MTGFAPQVWIARLPHYLTKPAKANETASMADRSTEAVDPAEMGDAAEFLRRAVSWVQPSSERPSVGKSE
jgi:hypothetical protein